MKKTIISKGKMLTLVLGLLFAASVLPSCGIICEPDPIEDPGDPWGDDKDPWGGEDDPFGGK